MTDLQSSHQRPFTSALVIPTGIGATVGGFGGDATPVLNLLASVSDLLITHPNVANAANFQRLPENAFYVEGYGLDQFFRNRWALRPTRKNKIGVVFDAAIEPGMLTLHLNTINSVQAVYGVEVIGYTLTSEPLTLTCGWTPSGSSSGQLLNPVPLLSACRHLLQQGADALAICVQMPELQGETPYGEGKGVDPVGGIEAILSHLVVSTLKVPAAHAPVFTQAQAMPEFETIVDPRAASEYITPTFLPCVLTGLSRAPRWIDASDALPYDLTRQNLDVLITPIDALGGIPALACMEAGIPILSVAENTTVMEISSQHWEEILGPSLSRNVFTATSYLEAAGMMQAMRLGLRLPLSTTMPVPELPEAHPIVSLSARL